MAESTVVQIPWYRQKTTWSVLGAIVATAGGYAMGEIGLVTAIGAILGELALVFARQGIEKIKG